jgi:hypothetical protein
MGTYKVNKIHNITKMKKAQTFLMFVLHSGAYYVSLCSYDTTLSIMTFSITTFSITALTILTFSIAINITRHTIMT